ncbi:hypothetical protein SBV1_370077 [Verrucomicrobia bacterium]|nr:hypothetical protein SBV1_370077 [Verrucomicrobiota bacterium]
MTAPQSNLGPCGQGKENQVQPAAIEFLGDPQPAEGRAILEADGTLGVFWREDQSQRAATYPKIPAILRLSEGRSFAILAVGPCRFDAQIPHLHFDAVPISKYQISSRPPRVQARVTIPTGETAIAEFDSRGDGEVVYLVLDRGAVRSTLPFHLGVVRTDLTDDKGQAISQDQPLPPVCHYSAEPIPLDERLMKLPGWQKGFRILPP